MCYLLSWLNRRVRNRTHGGVRGRENLFNFPSYSIGAMDATVLFARGCADRVRGGTEGGLRSRPVPGLMNE